MHFSQFDHRSAQRIAFITDRCDHIVSSNHLQAALIPDPLQPSPNILAHVRRKRYLGIQPAYSM